ncbi:MAG: branched-chain amino acid ABC transporter substrate-binding protein [SAR324 cluster bacterium]|nr:branched-chain amino acid ABC transporter substrate-binding protein [SAR324 cluster bacterium]
MKIKKWIICWSTIIFMAAGTIQPAAAETIKIGLIEPFSGPVGNAGNAFAQHIQDQVNRINAAGGVLGGQLLEVVRFDNKVSPKESLIQLSNAIDQGVHYIGQGVGSHVAGALIDAIKKHNQRNPGQEVVFFNYAAITPAFTEEKCDFWHFRFDAHVDMRMAAITDAIMVRKDIKKVYLIGQNYSFGKAVRDAARKMLKEKRPDIEIAGDELHPIAKIKDFSPYVSKIKQSGADIVITGNWGSDLSLLVRAAKDAGLGTEFFTFYASSLGAPTAIGEAGYDKVKAVSEWHNNLGVEENKPEEIQFQQEYEKKYGTKAPFLYGRMRTLVQMFAKALNQAGENNPKKVAFALEGMEHETPYGKVMMQAADHQLLQPLYVYTFTKVGTKGVKFGIEGTQIGFTTDKKIEATSTRTPSSCQMKRPQA